MDFLGQEENVSELSELTETEAITADTLQKEAKVLLTEACREQAVKAAGFVGYLSSTNMLGAAAQLHDIAINTRAANLAFGDQGLGSKKFTEREAAQAALVDIGTTVLPLMQKAKEEARDLEIANRADQTTKQINRDMLAIQALHKYIDPKLNPLFALFKVDYAERDKRLLHDLTDAIIEGRLNDLQKVLEAYPDKQKLLRMLHYLPPAFFRGLNFQIKEFPKDHLLLRMHLHMKPGEATKPYIEVSSDPSRPVGIGGHVSTAKPRPDLQLRTFPGPISDGMQRSSEPSEDRFIYSYDGQGPRADDPSLAALARTFRRRIIWASEDIERGK